VTAASDGTLSTEYEVPQIRLTLAAMPRRLPVLLAKAVAVAELVVGAGALGTLGARGAGRLVLATNGFDDAPGAPHWSLIAGSTLRAAVGTVGYLVLVALLGLGLAAVVRDAATAIVAVLALLFLFPLLGLVLTSPTWQHRLDRYAPMNAGLAVQSTRTHDHLAIGPWAGLAVLAAYSAAVLLAGTTTFLTRDS
jgi:ABC-2 type transport system permease protein